MLILTRTVGTKIMVGPEIEVTVIEIKGKQVRLGVQAPIAKYPIYREEIYKRILAEKNCVA